MRYSIPAMHCSGCAKGVTAAILEIDPAAKVEFDLTVREAEIESAAAPEAILAALAEADFPARVL